MSSEASLFDFASFLGSHSLSDVTIVLTTPIQDAEEEDQGTPPAKRTRLAAQRGAPSAALSPAPTAAAAEEIAAHGVVLAGCSAYFKAQLERWQNEQQPGAKPRIVLTLSSHEEAEAAKALLHYIYKRRLPDGASQQQLLVMLQLADRFGVHACAAACANALSEQELTWQTLEQLLALPPFFFESELCAGLVSKASDQLQQQLGDLEVAWADESSRSKWLQLPLKGVQLLLGDERTRVSYENTALVAATAWVQQHEDSLTLQDKRLLAGLLRCPYFTPLFAASVAMDMTWLVEALGRQCLAAAMGMAQVVAAMPQDEQAAAFGNTAEMHWPASWVLGRRPASACQEAVLTWHVPLAELEDVFDGATQRSPGSVSFGGLEWFLSVSRQDVAGESDDVDSAAAGATVGVFIAALLPDGMEACLRPDAGDVIVSLRQATVTGVWRGGGLEVGTNTISNYAITPPFVAATGWGEGDFWDTGTMKEWSPVKWAPWLDSQGRMELRLRIEEFV